MSNILNDTVQKASLKLSDDNISVIHYNGLDNGVTSKYQTYEIVLLAICASILAVLTIVGNLLVMISVGINKRLRTLNNYFIVSLSIADASIGMFSIPLFTVYVLLGYWPFGPLPCDLWLSLDYSMSNSSSLHLLLICIDRFLSVQKPLTYRPNRTPRKVITMLIVTWTFSIFLWTPWIFSIPAIEGGRTVPERECYIQFLYSNIYVTISTHVLAFWLPVILMIAFYLRVYLITKEHMLFKLQYANPKGVCSSPYVVGKDETKGKDKLNRSVHDKAAKTLSAILIAFLITWMPYHVNVIVSCFCVDCIPTELYNFGYWFCYINSTVNPFLYALCNGEFRRTFLKILSCNVKKIHKRRGTLTNSSQQHIYTSNYSDTTQSTM